MANYKKSFNFKHGVQVDVDNFVVNSIGNVGVGTSAPGQLLDVYGTARVNGLTTTTTLAVTGDSQFYSDVKIGTAVTISNGIVTATSYYGDGTKLSGIVGYHTTAWNLGAVGLTTTTPVGVGTDTAIASYDLVVGGDPNSTSGISLVKEGNLKSSGTITATGGFIGTVRSSDLRGLIEDARLPDIITSNINRTTGVSTFSTIKVGTAVTINSGVVTATTFVGSLTGTATNSSGLTGTPNISVGIITGNNDIHLTGAGSSIGIGTNDPTADLAIKKSSGSLLEVVSDSGQARIAIGNSVGVGKSTGVLRFNNQRLELRNKDVRGIDFIVNDGQSGAGGSIRFINNTANLAQITTEGKLALGNYIDNNPPNQLSVGAGATFGGASYFGSTLEVKGNAGLQNVSVGGTLSFTGRIVVPVVNDVAEVAYATTATGTIVFNSVDNKFRGYRGDTLGWVDFH